MQITTVCRVGDRGGREIGKDSTKAVSWERGIAKAIDQLLLDAQKKKGRKNNIKSCYDGCSRRGMLRPKMY